MKANKSGQDGQSHKLQKTNKAPGTGTGTGKSEIVGKAQLADGTALPSILFFSYTSERVSQDITGGGQLATVKQLKPARPVGAGIDDDTRRAEAAAEFEARAGWVAELVRTEKDFGLRLLKLAGGTGFANGGAVAFNGGGMAARAARHLWKVRGVEPSSTSLDDAGAAAVAALVEFFQPGNASPWLYDQREFGTADLEQPAIIRAAAARAWRAAFRSLTNDASEGKTGRNSSEKSAAAVPLSPENLDVERASLARWAAQSGVQPDDAQALARREIAAFVWRALVPRSGRGANFQRARSGAIRRARFLIRLIHGQSWADAARLAGYESGAAAAKVLATAGTLEQLAAAQRAAFSAHPALRSLDKARRGLARQAARAMRDAKQLAFAAGIRREIQPKQFKGWRDLRPAVSADGFIEWEWPWLGVVEQVNVQTYFPTRRRFQAGQVVTETIAASAPRAWSQAVDQRAAAVARARTAKARFNQFRQSGAADWAEATKGLRAGFLR